MDPPGQTLGRHPLRQDRIRPIHPASGAKELDWQPPPDQQPGSRQKSPVPFHRMVSVHQTDQQTLRRDAEFPPDPETCILVATEPVRVHPDRDLPTITWLHAQSAVL